MRDQRWGRRSLMFGPSHPKRHLAPRLWSFVELLSSSYLHSRNIGAKNVYLIQRLHWALKRKSVASAAIFVVITRVQLDSSTNAYMLMYRQVCKERNIGFMDVNRMPEHILDLINAMKNQDEADKRRRELDKSTCKVRTGRATRLPLPPLDKPSHPLFPTPPFSAPPCSRLKAAGAW